MPFPNASRSLCVRSHSVFGLTTRYRHASPIYLVVMGVKISIDHRQLSKMTIYTHCMTVARVSVTIRIYVFGLNLGATIIVHPGPRACSTPSSDAEV